MKQLLGTEEKEETALIMIYTADPNFFLLGLYSSIENRVSQELYRVKGQ
jgi:hypothetical protein